MILKLQPASEAPEKFTETQFAGLHPLEFLTCRSRVKSAISIFSNPSTLADADAANQEPILWELEQLLSGMKKAKGIW